MTVRPPSFTKFEKNIQAHEESMRSIAWAISRHEPKMTATYAKAEEDFYFECIAEIQRDRLSLVRFLELQFKPIADTHLRPVLVGTLEHPFEPTAAPINKLLLAYLLKTKRISYSIRDRATQRSELDDWARESPVSRSKRIVICRFGAEKNFPLKSSAGPSSRPPLIPDGIEVVIHSGGATAVETELESHLVDALSGITGGEYVYFDEMPDPNIRARYGLDTEAVIRATRKRNLWILDAFAKEHLEAENVKLDDKTGRWIILTKLTDDQIKENLTRIGGLDGNFVGAPIVLSEEFSSSKGGDF